MEKFNVKFTLKDLKTQDVLQVYYSKGTSGKYVIAVKDRFKSIEKEDFIYLLESCKIVNLAFVQPASLEENIKAWTAEYVGSQPAEKLKERYVRVSQIVAKYGGKAGDKYSWGAFIQAFSDKIEPLVASLFYIQPLAQSFNYSRAAFMIMEADTAYQYASFRLMCCLATLELVKTNIGLDPFRAAQAATRGASKILSEAIYAANKKSKFLPDMAEVNAKRLNEVLLVNLDIKDPTHFCMGSYPVDFRMYLQSITFRRRQQTPEDFQRAKNLIMPVLQITDLSKANVGTRIMLQDKEAAWRKIYFDNMKLVKAVARSVKRVINSGPAGLSVQTGIIRDYSNYAVDISMVANKP